MAKKRAAGSDPEEEDDDQVMNGDHNDEDEGGDGGSGSDDEEMQEVEEDDVEEISTASSPSPQKRKDMTLRSGRRKRRRSLQTTGLTPPPESRKKSKRSRTSAKTSTIKKQQTAASLTKPTTSNGDQKQPALSDRASPEIAPDPRRISYANASVIPSNIHEERSDEVSENGDDSEELNILPPKFGVQANGTAKNDVSGEEDEQSAPHDESIPCANGEAEHHEADADEQDEASKQPVTEEIDAGEREKVGEITGEDSFIETKSTSIGVSILERLVIFVILGFVSLLLTMPEVIKLAEIVVPLDESLLPEAKSLPKIKIPNDDDAVDSKVEMSSEELQSWNKKFLNNFQRLSRAKTAYRVSYENFDELYTESIKEIDQLEEELQTRQELAEKRLVNLNRLKKNLTEKQGTDNFEEIRGLAQQLLGKSVIETSSIPLWNVSKDLDANCTSVNVRGDLDDEDEDEDAEEMETESKPLLTAKLLEDSEENLSMQSMITADKFIGGTVATDRIRNWVKSKIVKAVEEDEDIQGVMEEIDEFALQLTEIAAKRGKTDGGNSGTPYLDLLLGGIIEDSLEVHRADITGIFDHATLTNGAEVIYGGKRGTSKSLVDSLPIVNRILQASNLRFYGFGPEAALTPTYPPNTPGQCWALRQTPLKELLKERELFEKFVEVPDDFKRGNFGTLTIRLDSPVIVESVVIEHPPRQFSKQMTSAIRSFRVVGYEDDMASSKAWNLGAFEYNINDNLEQNEYLQEFDVASTVFGKEIPPLQSISLAIDSNYGHTYTCLYRFRVHGRTEK